GSSPSGFTRSGIQYQPTGGLGAPACGDRGQVGCPEMRKHESVAYKPISGKRDTQLGINTGSPAFLLDGPHCGSWCMKSASLIVDPHQTYEGLKDLGSRLKPGQAGASGQ